MKAAFVVLFVLAALSVAHSMSFSDWKRAHNKTYANSADESHRMAIYLDNVEKVREMNIRASTPNSGLEGEFSVNQFSDMTFDEFKASYLSSFIPQASNGLEDTMDWQGRVPPNDVDWRAKGAVTPVKDQGQCGSCWAFATTGTTEGAWFIAKGQLVSLSEQDEVDCSKKQHNMGCNGGRADWGLDYIKAAKGINTEPSYPYTGRDGACKHKPEPIGATITAYKKVKSKDENDLMNAVSTEPVAVAICVTNAWANYKSGVFFDNSCKSGEFDLSHAVLAVGYGTDAGKDYWIVKNSWGGKWGDQGFIKMARNRQNNCGISTDAYYPQI